MGRPEALAEGLHFPTGLTFDPEGNVYVAESGLPFASAAAVNATAPPDGNVAPPGHYLLFLVDHDRVPSLGAWIQLT
jgi:hypothetical protein